MANFLEPRPSACTTWKIKKQYAQCNKIDTKLGHKHVLDSAVSQLRPFLPPQKCSFLVHSQHLISWELLLRCTSFTPSSSSSSSWRARPQPLQEQILSPPHRESLCPALWTPAKGHIYTVQMWSYLFNIKTCKGWKERRTVPWKGGCKVRLAWHLSASLLMFQFRVTDMWRRQTGFLRRTMVPVMEFPVFKLTGLSSMNRVCFQCVGLKRKTNFQGNQCSLCSWLILLGQNITNFQEKGRMTK